jgi:hypothetical protein
MQWSWHALGIHPGILPVPNVAPTSADFSLLAGYDSTNMLGNQRRENALIKACVFEKILLGMPFSALSEWCTHCFSA